MQDILTILLLFLLLITLLLIARDGIKIDLLQKNRKYNGFFKSVLLRILNQGGNSWFLAPFPDIDEYDSIQLKNIKRDKNKKVMVFWFLILIYIVGHILID